MYKPFIFKRGKGKKGIKNEMKNEKEN